jgi:hypothetical protein
MNVDPFSKCTNVLADISPVHFENEKHPRDKRFIKIA